MSDKKCRTFWCNFLILIIIFSIKFMLRILLSVFVTQAGGEPFRDFLRPVSFKPFSQSMISNSETAGAGTPDFARKLMRKNMPSYFASMGMAISEMLSEPGASAICVQCS